MLVVFELLFLLVIVLVVALALVLLVLFVFWLCCAAGSVAGVFIDVIDIACRLCVCVFVLGVSGWLTSEV